MRENACFSMARRSSRRPMRRGSRLWRERADSPPRTPRKYYFSAIFFQPYHSPMESAEQQWQQLKERYAQMTEDELAALAQSASDLTEVAREALQAVIAER